jgi:hypothetical protein
LYFYQLCALFEFYVEKYLIWMFFGVVWLWQTHHTIFNITWQNFRIGLVCWYVGQQPSRDHARCSREIQKVVGKNEYLHTAPFHNKALGLMQHAVSSSR